MNSKKQNKQDKGLSVKELKELLLVKNVKLNVKIAPLPDFLK